MVVFSTEEFTCGFQSKGSSLEVHLISINLFPVENYMTPQPQGPKAALRSRRCISVGSKPFATKNAEPRCLRSIGSPKGARPEATAGAKRPGEREVVSDGFQKLWILPRKEKTVIVILARPQEPHLGITLQASCAPGACAACGGACGSTSGASPGVPEDGHVAREATVGLGVGVGWYDIPGIKMIFLMSSL